MDLGSVISINYRTHIQALPARAAICGLHDRPDALIKKVHQPNALFRANVGTRATAHAKAPVYYIL
jgi:hypothetical protein